MTRFNDRTMVTTHTIHLRFLLLGIFTILLLPLNGHAEVSEIPAIEEWAKNETVIVGGDYNFPPYEFIDESGQPTGYNVDITKAIAEVMGLNIEIILADWDDVRNRFNQQEIDVLQGMSITAERQKTISFTPPSVRIRQSIFGRDDSEAIDSLSDLQGKEVIVQSQGSMHDFLLNTNIDVTIVPITTHVDALRLLSSGQHDYAIVANLPGLYLSKELGLSNIDIVGNPFSSGGYTYAALKGNENILFQFTEGLAILRNTGRQQEIYDKWLGVLEKDDSLIWRKLGILAAAISILLCLVAIVVTVWIRALRSQVDKRSAELHENQMQLIQADKMASLGVLVSGVAHEVNNPTGLLLLNLPLLRDAWRDAKPILDQHYQTQGDFELAGLHYSRVQEELPILIDEMEGGAHRIKRIVESLKDFARYDTAEHRKMSDVNRIVNESINLIKNTIKNYTDNFSVAYDPSLPLVYVNSQRIEQVIINLLLNACQSLDSRDKCVHIKTEYDHKNTCVNIVVIDEGCGIEKENLERLQEPFFTTKRETGGTGLGLSVSSTIAKNHAGQLVFSSRVHEGTVATLSIPTAPKTA